MTWHYTICCVNRSLLRCDKANMKKSADFCTCMVEFCRPAHICPVTYWDSVRDTHRFASFVNWRNSCQLYANAPVSDLQGDSVNDQSLLYLNNLSCLISVDCYRISEINLCTRCILKSLLKKCWVSEVCVSVKIELSCTEFRCT